MLIFIVDIWHSMLSVKGALIQLLTHSLPEVANNGLWLSICDVICELLPTDTAAGDFLFL